MLRLAQSSILGAADLPEEFAAFSKFDEVTRRVLLRVVQGSPYLRRSLLRDEDWALSVLDLPRDEVVASIYQTLHAVADDDVVGLSNALRVAKRRLAFWLGLFDIARLHDVMETTRLLTEFADYATNRALVTSLTALVKTGKLPDKFASQNCGGVFVLAMGKMGAFELNYSSDIDLIVFFDDSAHEEGAWQEFRKPLIRAVQNMSKLLSEIQGEGYVFRVDLRLRPDPATTPVLMPADQAESYYEAFGRTWERGAFIKARVAAGDLTAGNGFLTALRPFIWRRYLDFAAIEDAHNMRLQIKGHKGLGGPIQFAGHNLKLGRGGIREIEFFVQTRQLIFGGRDEDYRLRGTLEGLALLHAKAQIDNEVLEVLTKSYKTLRRYEHFVQMINDEQRHDVPKSDDGLAKLAALTGKSLSDMEAEILPILHKVDEIVEANYQGMPLSENTVELSETSAEIVEGWYALPALRTERARQIFDRIRTPILEKLSSSNDSEQALREFDRFLRAQPAGVQIFSLFDANPSLLDLLAEICAMTPREAKRLGENARIFEAVLSSSFFTPIEDMSAYRVELSEQFKKEVPDDTDFEAALDGARRFAKEAQFRIAVHLLRNLMSGHVAGIAFSKIAETVFNGLYPFVLNELERRYGKIDGEGVAVIALGKLGSDEMTISSDLDLIFVYDAPSDAISGGKRGLSTTAYFARFTQNMIAALTVPTSEGALYEVDMRLRPSGRQGPVATSLTRFIDYQSQEAWVWEHMALLRARVIAGPASLCKKLDRALHQVFEKTWADDEVVAQVNEMRMRLFEHKPLEHPYELKAGAGRLMDCELFIQAMALRAKIGAPHKRMRNTIKELAKVGAISSQESDDLQGCYDLLYELQQLARLSYENGLPKDGLDTAWRLRQQEITGAETDDDFVQVLDLNAQKVAALFAKYFPINEEDGRE